MAPHFVWLLAPGLASVPGKFALAKRAKRKKEAARKLWRLHKRLDPTPSSIFSTASATRFTFSKLNNPAHQCCCLRFTSFRRGYRWRTNAGGRSARLPRLRTISSIAPSKPIGNASAPIANTTTTAPISPASLQFHSRTNQIVRPHVALQNSAERCFQREFRMTEQFYKSHAPRLKKVPSSRPRPTKCPTSALFSKIPTIPTAITSSSIAPRAAAPKTRPYGSTRASRNRLRTLFLRRRRPDVHHRRPAQTQLRPARARHAQRPPSLRKIRANTASARKPSSRRAKPCRNFSSCSSIGARTAAAPKAIFSSKSCAKPPKPNGSASAPSVQRLPRRLARSHLQNPRSHAALQNRRRICLPARSAFLISDSPLNRLTFLTLFPLPRPFVTMKIPSRACPHTVRLVRNHQHERSKCPGDGRK